VVFHYWFIKPLHQQQHPQTQLLISFTTSRSNTTPSSQQGCPLQHVVGDPATKTTTHRDPTVLFPSLIVKIKSRSPTKTPLVLTIMAAHQLLLPTTTDPPLLAHTRQHS